MKHYFAFEYDPIANLMVELPSCEMVEWLKAFRKCFFLSSNMLLSKKHDIPENFTNPFVGCVCELLYIQFNGLENYLCDIRIQVPTKTRKKVLVMRRRRQQHQYQVFNNNAIQFEMSSLLSSFLRVQ